MKTLQTRFRKYWPLIGLLVFLVALNIVFYYISPTTIVSLVGPDNVYLVAFLVATLGGLSTLAGPVLYTTIITFAAGGAGPFFLGLSAGLGIFISDSVFYWLAWHGRRVAPPNWQQKIERVTNWFEKKPLWAVLLIIYLVISFTPFPNDLIMITLALSNYSYRTLMPTIFLGSLTVALVMAYLGNIWGWLL